MPFYDYQCSKCNHTFNKMQKIADRNLPTTEPCPKCSEADSIELQIGAPILSDSIRMGLMKPPEGFREVLRQIDKNAGPQSQLKKTSSYL